MDGRGRRTWNQDVCIKEQVNEEYMWDTEGCKRMNETLKRDKEDDTNGGTEHVKLESETD